MKPITVLLADDHTVVREGLRALLEMENDFEIVGEATNGRQAVNMAKALRPAVVVLDIAMPQLNGLEAARQILQLDAPIPKVVILSAHSDEAYVERVAEIGVMGYLIKQTSAHILGRAIRDVCSGKRFYSPCVAERMYDSTRSASKQAPQSGRSGRRLRKVTHLTPRENEVLQLVAEGLANKQVAAELEISIKTVEKHRQSVMDKLNLHDTAALTRYAISAGIIESSVQCTIVSGH